MYKFIILYFATVNFLGWLLNVLDKSRAKKGKYRVPERRLWLVAVLGGAPAEYITMKTIRHKTKHRSFMIGMPILGVIDLAAFIILIVYTLPSIPAIPK